MLGNAAGEEGADFPEKIIMKVYGSTLLVLRGGGGWVSHFPEKSVT